MFSLSSLFPYSNCTEKASARRELNSFSLTLPSLGQTSLENGYLLLLMVLQFYCVFIHGTGGFLGHLEFLPLLLTSVSCAVGVVWSWILSYYQLFARDSTNKQK